MIICCKVIQACVKILYQYMLLQASLPAALIILFPVCYCDRSGPFSAWVTEISDCSVFPVIPVFDAYVHGTDLMPFCGGAVTWVDKNRATGITHLDFRAFGTALTTSLSVNRREEIWQLDHWVDESLPLKSHSKGCGQWSKYPRGELWCVVSLRGWYWGQSSSTSLSVTGTGEEVNFWVCNDKPLLCIRQKGWTITTRSCRPGFQANKRRTLWGEMEFFIKVMFSCTQLNCKTPLPSLQGGSWRFLTLLVGHNCLNWTATPWGCHVSEGVKTHQTPKVPPD